MPDAIVLGAGVSGLAAARALRRQGAEVLVVEAGAAPGGSLKTAAGDGFTAELGASSVQEAPELLALAGDAGCADRLVPASPLARRRFLLHRGRLVALPSSPPGLLRTPLLSGGAKARVLTEPWRRRGASGPEESVAAFFRRRLGPEPVSTLIDALVLGIYSGDPAELAIGHAFPRVHALERDYGSLIKGARKGGFGPTRLLSFRGGWAAFAAALAAGLEVETESRVELVVRHGSGFRVRIKQSGAEREHAVPRLVVALPAAEAARALAPLHPLGAAGGLDTMPHAPVAVVSLGWERSAVAHPLDGFGFLVPHGEGRPLLGAIFASTVFPHTAPAGHVLVNSMVGGRRRPELVELPENDLLALVRRELGDLLGARGAPVFARLARWRPGIPQPTAAAASVRAAAESLERANPGLTLLGHWLHGVGVPACVKAGWAVRL